MRDQTERSKNHFEPRLQADSSLDINAWRSFVNAAYSY